MYRFNCEIDDKDKVVLQKILDKLNDNYSFSDCEELYTISDLMTYLGIENRKRFVELRNLKKNKIIKYVLSGHSFRISINPLFFSNGNINIGCFLDFKKEIKEFNYSLYLKLCDKFEVVK